MTISLRILFLTFILSNFACDWIFQNSSSNPPPNPPPGNKDSYECLKPLNADIYIASDSKASVQDGKSWESAYRDFSKVAERINELRKVDLNKDILVVVKAGEYKAQDKQTLLSLPNPSFKKQGLISFQGGFKGEYACQEDQDPTLFHKTILKGNNESVITAGSLSFIFQGFLFAEGKAGTGGAFSCLTCGVQFRDVLFEKNKAENGGAIYIQQSGAPVKLNDIILKGNEATKGGAIYIVSSTAEITLENVNFLSNAAEKGGGIYMEDIFSDAGLKNVKFEKNNATELGGAIFIEGAKTLQLKIEKGSFSENSAQFGGAIASRINHRSYTGEMELNHTVFFRNRASEDGGAIHNSLILNIQNCLFNENSSAGNGGAIFTPGHDDVGELLVKNSIFKKNEANKSGGAIFHKAYLNLDLQNSEFRENTANIDGGALAILQRAVNDKAKLDSVKIIENKANRGGAIYTDFKYSKIQMRVNKAQFVGNQPATDDYEGIQGIFSESEYAFEFLKNP